MNNLNLDNVVVKSEKYLFWLLVLLSAAAWLALIVVTTGIIIPIILVFMLLGVFVHSGFISYIRGTGAIVSDKQFPELNKLYDDAFSKLEMKKKPTLILLQSNGILNALATRFLGRNYVVLYSAIVDELYDDKAAISFYIGHELGHIKRKHLVWNGFVSLFSWVPVIGSGYRRACETTCDRYGLFCCDSSDSAVRAMAALAVGGKYNKILNLDAYMDQLKLTGGFWMSLHEIFAYYPWLTKRVARISSNETRIPRRSFWAWVLAMLVLLTVALYISAIIAGFVDGFMSANLGQMFNNNSNIMYQLEYEGQNGATGYPSSDGVPYGEVYQYMEQNQGAPQGAVEEWGEDNFYGQSPYSE